MQISDGGLAFLVTSAGAAPGTQLVLRKLGVGLNLIRCCLEMLEGQQSGHTSPAAEPAGWWPGLRLLGSRRLRTALSDVERECGCSPFRGSERNARAPGTRTAPSGGPRTAPSDVDSECGCSPFRGSERDAQGPGAQRYVRFDAAAPSNRRRCPGATEVFENLVSCVAQALAEEATPLLMPLMDIVAQGALTSLEFDPITVRPPGGPRPPPLLLPPTHPPMMVPSQPASRLLLNFRVQSCSCLGLDSALTSER